MAVASSIARNKLNYLVKNLLKKVKYMTKHNVQHLEQRTKARVKTAGEHATTNAQNAGRTVVKPFTEGAGIRAGAAAADTLMAPSGLCLRKT